jgi:hypothetical protein
MALVAISAMRSTVLKSAVSRFFVNPKVRPLVVSPNARLPPIPAYENLVYTAHRHGRGLPPPFRRDQPHPSTSPSSAAYMRPQPERSFPVSGNVGGEDVSPVVEAGRGHQLNWYRLEHWVVFVGIEVSISMARPLPLARDLREHHDWRRFLDDLKRLSGSSEVPLVELTAFIVHTVSSNMRR